MNNNNYFRNNFICHGHDHDNGHDQSHGTKGHSHAPRTKHSLYNRIKIEPNSKSNLKY